jgi:hypothetical protein
MINIDLEYPPNATRDYPKNCKAVDHKIDFSIPYLAMIIPSITGSTIFGKLYIE